MLLKFSGLDAADTLTVRRMVAAKVKDIDKVYKSHQAALEADEDAKPAPSLAKTAAGHRSWCKRFDSTTPNQQQLQELLHGVLIEIYAAELLKGVRKGSRCII